MSDLPALEPHLSHPSLSNPSRSVSDTGLTTFPNPFADEPEPGLLPAFLSKVKSTFAGASSSSSSTSIPQLSSGASKSGDKQDGGGAKGPQTEAQQIAEAAKARASALGRVQSGSASSPSAEPIPTVQIPSEASSSWASPTVLQPPPALAQTSRPIKAPSNSASTASTAPPSVAPSSAPSKRLVAPHERIWRPTGASPAQVTVSPITSVTTTVQAQSHSHTATSSSPQEHALHHAPTSKPFPPRAHFGLQNAMTSSAHLPIRHAHNSSLSRVRRSSIATIPDSPSSVSLSAMIAANAELSQNMSYVPGFPMGQDDTRSVRSLGLVKRGNSVSKIIRRMRGEGLSKHYWMADEHCRECYDCKSVFTAWRRKHHCRICGQIFCSRCASNIIGARRFGQEGAVRVCNLCLKIMEEYKDDEDDDRRSIHSVSTSVRLPSISDRAFLDAAALSPDIPFAKSPFAASQLFTSHPNDSLNAIDEMTVPTRWGGQGDSERPHTPNDASDGDEDDHIWATRPNTAAPFRRNLEEEGTDRGDESRTNSEPESPALYGPDVTAPPNTAVRILEPPGSKEEARPRIEFPRTDTISTDGGDVRIPLSRVDSNQPLIGLRTRLSSRTSQGGLTALIDSGDKTEGGLWRARSHSTAQAQRPEIISGASLQHFAEMLRQSIARADLPHPDEWHHVLSRLILRVPMNLRPDVRAGDSMDVRAFVKIKKVPGGRISDSEYVDGIVITKNVAHKAMPRRLVNPRIMVVTFPLDYHRIENQFMSLDPILAQEKDYLRLLVRRIVDVRPHIVLVERNVSRIALDYLLEANIAVARGVKLSAIHQVARCTQADVVASMDRLALEPRLGRCAEFQIQSFEHELIPGRRKSLMRFEGCVRDFGCTIILRGADLATLRKVKVVTDFMALVAYHLKNEIILYNDEHNILPPRPPMPGAYQELLASLRELDSVHVDEIAVDVAASPDSPTTPTAQPEEDDRQMQRREARLLTREIAQSLEPYLRTVLSASTAIRFPPPAPLAKMAELDMRLASLRQRRDEEEAAQILQEETKLPEPPKSAADPDPAATISGTTVPETKEIVPADVPSSTAMSAIATTTAPPKEVTRDPYRVLRKPEEIARESTLAQVEHQHAEQVRFWQLYTRRNIPDLRPEDYQGILYLYSLGCEGSEKPCVEPHLQHINFYQPGDATVGQFLEGLAADAIKRCPAKTCERLLLFHFRLLVHGDRRLQIAMDQFPCPSPGHEDQIITWSYCRLCQTPSPTTILRDETWKMSWGAYLEHCFYPPASSAGFACPHDAYRDQIRYFAHRNLAIRIHNEQIDLYEPLRPSITLQVRAETKVLLKNQEYEGALHKNAAFFDSVLFRLRSFDYDIVQPDKVSMLKTALETLLSRAVADREELVNLLNRTYKLTPMTDVLALNTVLRTLQDKVVQWDADFADIEKAFMPSESDLKQLTANHLKRLFANQDVFNSLNRNVAGMTVSEADEKETKISECDETPASTVAPTPSDLLSTSSSVVDDDGTTPLAGIVHPVTDPLLGSQTPAEYESDSTISAVKKESPEAGMRGRMDRVESSGLDSDAQLHPFISRLPRRTKPAPSIADLVKRFQESSSQAQFEPFEETPLERPRSSGSLSRSRRHRDKDASDSDNALKVRPKLRRGRTEQPTSRHREISRPGLLSDGDKSYAAYASRIPSSAARKSFAGQTESSRAHSRPASRPVSPSPRSGRTSPEKVDRLSAPGPSRHSASTMSDKPRLSGRSRGARISDALPPGLLRTAARRTLGGSSRVSSIARHFDRLTVEADRERQKRITMGRGKRARPVGVTKARVQVFDNLRDAFRDEFDSDSSEADDEDDNHSDDSAESGGEGKPTKTKSPTKSPTASPTKPSVEATPPIPVVTASTSDHLAVGPPDFMPVSNSASSFAAGSLLGDTRSEMSFTDRLQIELPNFETSAPLPSVPATPNLSNNADTADEALPKPAMSQMSQFSESEMSSGGERSSIMKTLTGLWAFRAGDFSPLEYPLSAAEHIFADSRVIIRETEPTSIIAFTLSSKTYRDKMRNVAFHQQKGGRNTEIFMPEDSGVVDRASTWDIVSLDDAVEPEDGARFENATHLKYDFESGSSTIFCRIFFAEQFAALRSACQCEDSFVESLARCVQFDAAGGKSGSAFLKTKDDRFIAKEISRLEMDALTKFAPAYFEYTRKAFQGQRPTVLAKIYGFFKIGYRNAITGRSMRMNVLVMENLFYERRFSKIYDLKGSTRNRLIQATGRVNEVLLDENLMEIVYKHPLYLREHAKRILRSALFNDTLFLSNLNVMDYSLVVGVDSDKHELVVGIVDYIRTFTWDKKLESWVKDSAFLGGAGKGEPTIVTPKQYKTRFRVAMERFYFPSVPDRWTKVGVEDPQPDDEASLLGA